MTDTQGAQEGALPDRSHIAAVANREELIYLLSQACELEHNVACIYLFAAYSLKTDVSEGGLTPEQAEMVRGWKRRLVKVSVEEMLHLSQMINILTAIGGAPHLRRPNFPLRGTILPINNLMTLEPFSRDTLEAFMCIEMPETGILSAKEQKEADEILARVSERKGLNGGGAADGDVVEIVAACEPFDIDFTTQSEFYHKIMTGLAGIPENELFIGPPEAQANGSFLQFGGQLKAVTDRRSALDAIAMVLEQGEAPTKAHPDAHFWVFRTIYHEYLKALSKAEKSGETFEPMRPVLSNPITRFHDDASGGTLIADPLTHQVAELFNGAYDTMLLIFLRFFAHTEESDEELEKLADGTMRLMRNVTRPLGEALTKMPVSHEPSLAGMTAGPGFGITRDVHLLPHKQSAWIFFGERLHELANVATKLIATRADQLPPEVEEAVAGLQALSLEFAPADRSWNADAELGEFRSIEAGQEPAVKPTVNGPLLVKNVEQFTNSKGEALPTSPEMALCRCGGSKNKPFCDGTHARRGFTSERSAKRTPDGVKDFPGEEITVHFNKLQCCAAGECAAGLPTVFHHGGAVRIAMGQPWIQPDREGAEKIIDVIRRCPSGALRYTYKGETGPDHTEPPNIRICRDGPYEIQGVVPLRTSFWSEDATRQIYTLCRCGASSNKPFCDGSHFRVKFKDEKN